MTALSSDRLQFKAPFQIVPETACKVTLYAGEGSGFELEASGCNLHRLCELLSRGASRGELASEGGTDPERIDGLMGALLERGIIATMPEPPRWPAPLLTRMDRQATYFRKYETPTVSRYDYLNRLQSAHVLLLGVGSLGSWCLQHLVATGIGRITAVDGDLVSESNLARQCFYRSTDVGCRKVEAAARAVAELSSWVDFRGVDRRLSSRGCVRRVLDECEPVDLVILTADEPVWEIAVFTAEAARDSGLPLLRGNSLGVGPLTRFGKTACPACDWPRVLGMVPKATDIVAYYRASTQGLAPKAAISTHIAIAGALLAQEAISFLSGAGPIRTENARLVTRDGLSTEQVPFERHSDCPVCAGLAERHD